jgi:hypothetical protein
MHFVFQLDKNNVVKVSDFGLSHFISADFYDKERPKGLASFRVLLSLLLFVLI